MARQFIVYDTESTGLKIVHDQDPTLPAGMGSRGDEVCQIGGMILDERMTPVKLFCHYCDTVTAEVSRGAFEVNGISMQEVRKYVRCQYLSNVLIDRVPEFFWDNTIFLGYNVEFDMSMVRQTLANTDVDFTWESFHGNIIPKSGRWAVDVSEFFKQTASASRGGGTYRRKLSSFAKELEDDREQFLVQYGAMPIDSNCMELLQEDWYKAHNSFFDAINTYLLWRDRVWRKKLV